MSRLLGVDVGGTQTKLLLADVAGERHDDVRHAVVPTPVGGVAMLGDAVAEFLGDDRVDGVGVSVPGILGADGTVLVSTNVPWLDGTRPAAALADRLGAPGVVVQDGTAAARAEALLGAGRGRDDIFVVALGTGIAGAHVVDGIVQSGAHRAAGELGHMASGTGRVCSCGQRGCLETEIGGRMIAARWDEIRGATGATARDLVAAADAGDERAIALIDEATSALAQTLLAMIALLDPGTIVIGGGLANARERILEPAIRKTRERATFHQVPPILAARLGLWGGAWGGVLAAEELATTDAPLG